MKYIAKQVHTNFYCIVIKLLWHTNDKKTSLFLIVMEVLQQTIIGQCREAVPNRKKIYLMLKKMKGWKELNQKWLNWSNMRCEAWPWHSLMFNYLWLILYITFGRSWIMGHLLSGMTLLDWSLQKLSSKRLLFGQCYDRM